MTRKSPIPRLSIVVPIGRDLAAFERTLISVLENQPLGCEVVVPHDGRYDDPFDLCGEVRFVVAESDQFVDLIAAAANAARGRVVHILADGIQATSGWAEEGLEKFEHVDAAAVAPVIRSSDTGKIIAAGWHDTASGLCRNACQGKKEAGGRSTRMVGAYLQASFWRSEVLRSLGGVFATRHSVDAAYLYEQMIRAAGWRCVLADECQLLHDGDHLPWQSTSLGRGMRLRAISNRFRNVGWIRSAATALRCLVVNAARPSLWAESLGQALAPLAAGATESRINACELPCCDDQELVISVDRAGNDHRRAA